MRESAVRQSLGFIFPIAEQERQLRPKDIEITPEMIEAGVEALVRAVPTGDLPTSFDFQLEIVCSVYGAMADSRRRHAKLLSTK
jgi:hypothetical protein